MSQRLLQSLFAWLLLTAAGFAIGPLHVSGPQLLDDRDRPVMLRGVAMGDPILAREGRPLSDYQHVATEWHANVVRLSIHPSVWKHQPHEKVLKLLARDVNAALEAGMYVIIDWHTIGFPNGYFEEPDPEWEDPSDFYDSNLAIATDFWKAVAGPFGADGRVLFELWNEPVFSKDDGEKSVGPKWAQLRQYLAGLVTTIRAISSNVIIATSNEWAYDLRGIRKHPLDGGNIAYAWHVYAGNDENDSTVWIKKLDALQTIAPVLVTEWGFQRNVQEHWRGTPESFGNKFRDDFLEKLHLHSTAWCWHPDWSPPMLKDDWKTPNEYGAFVKRYLTETNRQK